MITVEEIGKSLGDRQILNGISLELSPDEVLALVGPSGCGKTTLLRLIAGFEKPDAGRILIDDFEASSPTHSIEPHKRKLSMIFQDLALWPHLSAMGHIEFVLGEARGKQRRSYRERRSVEATELLDRVRLKGRMHHYPHQLSGGEKQRLAIARALSSRPAYLLMDEPFSSLDTEIKQEMIELIGEIGEKRRMGILYVTHNAEELAAIADRVVVLKAGRMAESSCRDAFSRTLHVLSAPFARKRGLP